jgi:hypothetical protein
MNQLESLYAVQLLQPLCTYLLTADGPRPGTTELLG